MNERREQGRADEGDRLAGVPARMEGRIDDLTRTVDVRRIIFSVYRTMTGAIVRGIEDGRSIAPRWAAELTGPISVVHRRGDGRAMPG